jgi:hypothetical protein
MMRRNLGIWSALFVIVGVAALALPAAAQAPAAPAPQLASTELAAPSGFTIKVGDTAWMKFGTNLQFWADWNQDQATEGYIQNLYLRRARFNVAGKVAEGVYFYYQLENANLGKAPKNLAGGFQTLDATIEWRIDKTFNIQAGLIYLPMSREAVKASGSQYMLDTSAYATLATGSLQGSSNRDTGFGVRGFTLDDHLEYRVLAVQGMRDASSHYAFRYLFRASYNIFDTETYAPAFTAMPSSYSQSSKKIVAIGSSYDFQRDYELYSADVFWSLPIGKDAKWEGTVWYQSMDGATLTTAIPKQNTFTAETGWYFKQVKTEPFVRWERKQVSSNYKLDEQRTMVGLSYYLSGYNAMLKAAWQNLKMPNDPAKITTNEYTLALNINY